MPLPFAINTESIDGDRYVVAVAGELDLFTVPELKSALRHALTSGHTRLVVDLTETSFLDSTAVAVLIGAVRRLQSRDRVLTIANADPHLVKTFETMGLTELFTIHPTRHQAVQALDADYAASSGAAPRVT
jgi:anti-sigma B factor antagonist